MILEVPANARQVRHGGNAEPVELRTVAYSRKHQGLRGLDRTGRQHNLARGFDPADCILPLELYAGDGVALDGQAINVGASQHGQVGLIHHRIEVAGGNVQPAAVADAHIGDRRAARTFLHDAVLVGEGRDAQGLCGLEEGRRNGAWIGSGLNEDLAAATAPLWIRNTVPVLDAPVDVEYVLVIPRLVAGLLGPVLEVVLVTASPDHPVDAGSSPNHLAHGLDDRAVVDARTAFGGEVPVKFAALIEEPSFGDQDAGFQILAARFEQEHLRIRVFSQASCHHRTGGAGTNDDIVIVGP